MRYISPIAKVCVGLGVYLIRLFYRYEEDALVEGLLPVVVKAVDSAMKRDSASGDSFDVAIINQKI